MIIVVDERELVTKGYASLFDKEGIAASGFGEDEFADWFRGAQGNELDSIEAVVIGACRDRYGLANSVKKRSSAAVIVIEDQKILGQTLELFAAGADDVVCKPVHVREIIARIGAISRRSGSADAFLTAGPIRIQTEGSDPLVAGEPLSLPRRELRILEYLVRNRGRRVTKAQIFHFVYGLFDSSIDDTVVESHISKLRKRLRQRLGYDPVDSKRHLGYRLLFEGAVDVEQGERPVEQPA